MTTEEVIDLLKSKGNPKYQELMKRFGVHTENIIGVGTKDFEAIAKQIKRSYEFSLELWDTGYYEARTMAATITEPDKLTIQDIDKWVWDFDSWALCDSVCLKALKYSSLAIDRIRYFAEQQEEYVRRTAFTLLAGHCIGAEKRTNNFDDFFFSYFDLIKEHCNDDRNFVKKAVNWAIRQIGKRNRLSLDKCIELCNEIIDTNPKSRPARWIAKSALREFRSEAVLARLSK